MGMFDEFTFEEGFDELPQGCPRDTWQTKGLDCEKSLEGWC